MNIFSRIDESINELESSEVNLSSFEGKDTLHPKFWINNKLNSRVRLRLLDIIDDFVNDLEVKWVEPKDTLFVGSLANYNWSKYSDIDIHIVYDFSEIYDKRPEFVRDYFNSKKDLWLQNHELLTIYGFPVEFYIEDINDKKDGTGRYSLETNEWLIEPKFVDGEVMDEDYIKNQVARYVTEFENIEKKLETEEDEHTTEQLGKRILRLFKQMGEGRKKGLSSENKQMSSGNIIYKAVRRIFGIDRIFKIYNKCYDYSKRIR